MIFNKQDPKPVNDLHPIKEKQDIPVDEILTKISPIIIILMILILVILISMHFRYSFSTEANRYEHMQNIVLNCIGVVING